MSPANTKWLVLLSDAAKQDLRDIVNWTADRFGDDQSRLYAALITETLQDLRSGPNIPGARRYKDIDDRLGTIHISRRRRKGRHILLFRTHDTERPTITVLRILHDAMDVARHFPASEDDAGNG
jgi:toxin ParE1/3/4